MTEPAHGIHLVFYDGLCALCDRTVRLLLRIDRHQQLSFAPLQGETAKWIARREPRIGDLETLWFLESLGTEKERVSTRSTGVLRMFARIGGVWRVVSWLRVIPRPLRDWVYRIVARRRYRWFGRFDTCKLPNAEVTERFLD